MDRRSFIKDGLGLGGAALLAPMLTSNSFADEKVLNLYIWGDYVNQVGIQDFEAQTGIKVNVSTYGTNDEVLNKLRATNGKGFDIVVPSITYGKQWYKYGLLKPLDTSRINIKGCEDSMWESSKNLGGKFRDKRYMVPYDWGTEGITVNTQKEPDFKTNEVSYGDLWTKGLDSKVTVRAHSAILGAGLYLDRIGKVPSNKMLDTYKSKEQMREIYSKITDFLISHKKNVRQFWSNAQDTMDAFMQNSCVIGQTWDGPAIRMMKETKGKIKYMAPKEGALAWMTGVGIPRGAKNISSAYAWINWYYNGGKAGAMHANKTGYNSCAKNASKYLNSEAKEIFEAVYSGDAIKNLWWYPEDPTWTLDIRNEFRDKFLEA